MHRVGRSDKSLIAIVSFFNLNFMLQEKAGEIAGRIWQVLNENGQLAGKDLKKATKVKSEKDLYLGLGWLLREDKIQTSETEKDILVCLK